MPDKAEQKPVTPAPLPPSIDLHGPDVKPLYVHDQEVWLEHDGRYWKIPPETPFRLPDGYRMKPGRKWRAVDPNDPDLPATKTPIKTGAGRPVKVSG